MKPDRAATAKKRGGPWLLSSLLVVALGAFAVALHLRRSPPPPPPHPPVAAIIPSNDITLSGSVRAQHVVPVTSTVQGNLEAFLADVGEDVFEGQPLARIGSAGLESTREAAQADADHARDLVTRAEAAVNAARLESSRADADATRARLQMERAQKIYDRQTTLHNAGATPRIVFEKSQSDFEAAQTEFQAMDKAARGSHEALQTTLDQFDAAKKLAAEKAAALDQAQNAFEAAEVRAPVAGTIVSRSGEPGQPADPTAPLFQIATDLYALEVPVQPRPEDLPRIHSGQQAIVSLFDLGSAGLPGTVREIKDGTVIVEFAGTLPGIKPGMRTDVRIKPD